MDIEKEIFIIGNDEIEFPEYKESESLCCDESIDSKCIYSCWSHDCDSLSIGSAKNLAFRSGSDTEE